MSIILYQSFWCLYGVYFRSDYSFLLPFRESFSVFHTFFCSIFGASTLGLPTVTLMVACLCPINFSLIALISLFLPITFILNISNQKKKKISNLSYTLPWFSAIPKHSRIDVFPVS